MASDTLGGGVQHRFTLDQVLEQIIVHAVQCCRQHAAQPLRRQVIELCCGVPLGVVEVWCKAAMARAISAVARMLAPVVSVAGDRMIELTADVD